MVTSEDIFEAYYDCLKRKRSKNSAIAYRMGGEGLEAKLLSLRDRINDRTYHPGTSICFVVRKPRYREVFAADFEDRIVHHYIALRTEPLFESIFSPRTFNCRKGKGQLYGVKMLSDDIRKATENYTRDAWICKCDIKGFFMSIDKQLLEDKVDRFIVERYKGDDIEDLRFLCRTVIRHHPEDDCIRRSPAEYWTHLSPDKSLFTNGRGKGIAIGNLFAQHFANFLLNDLDWYLEEIGIEYHGRYVDDFYMIHHDKDFLLSRVPLIRAKLADLKLTLHPRKFYFQHYTKGVSFTGAIVKPWSMYVEGRVLNNFEAAVKRLGRVRKVDQIYHHVASVNSYLGQMAHVNEYGAKRRILANLNPRLDIFVHVRHDFGSVTIDKSFRPHRIVRNRLRDGTFYCDRDPRHGSHPSPSHKVRSRRKRDRERRNSNNLSKQTKK